MRSQKKKRIENPSKHGKKKTMCDHILSNIFKLSTVHLQNAASFNTSMANLWSCPNLCLQIHHHLGMLRSLQAGYHGHGSNCGWSQWLDDGYLTLPAMYHWMILSASNGTSSWTSLKQTTLRWFFKGARQCQRDAFRLPALSSLTVQIAPTQRPTVGRGRHCRRERWSWQHRWSFLEGLTPEKVRSFNHNQNLRAKNLAQLEWTTRTEKKNVNSLQPTIQLGFLLSSPFKETSVLATLERCSVCVCARALSSGAFCISP